MKKTTTLLNIASCSCLALCLAGSLIADTAPPPPSPDSFIAPAVQSSGFSRQGSGKFYVYGRTMEGDTDYGFGGDLNDDGAIFGLGFEKFTSDHLAVNLEIGVGNLDSTIGGSSFDTTHFEFRVGLEYAVLKTSLTPIITGEIGVANQSGTIRGLDFDESLFTYGLGLGVRYDVSDDFSVRAVYHWDFTDFEDSLDNTEYTGFQLSLGFRF